MMVSASVSASASALVVPRERSYRDARRRGTDRDGGKRPCSETSTHEIRLLVGLRVVIWPRRRVDVALV
jgi:hypothetical protein